MCFIYKCSTCVYNLYNFCLYRHIYEICICLCCILYFMYLVLHFPFSRGYRGFDAVKSTTLTRSMQKGKTQPSTNWFNPPRGMLQIPPEKRHFWGFDRRDVSRGKPSGRDGGGEPMAAEPRVRFPSVSQKLARAELFRRALPCSEGEGNYLPSVSTQIYVYPHAFP